MMMGDGRRVEPSSAVTGGDKHKKCKANFKQYHGSAGCRSSCLFDGWYGDTQGKQGGNYQR